MPAIETLGETLPDLILEVVVDPSHPDHFQLHTWNGRRATTTSKVDHGGASYIPMRISRGVAESVRFAPSSLHFGSTPKLVSSIREFLSTYARLQPEVANLLVAFGLASWFCDAMPVAPVLYLLGPESTVSTVLRLLACVCRRPVLLADIDLEGLATLPAGLGATFLFNQRKISRRVSRALLASTQRHFLIIRGRNRLALYGARAFSCEGIPIDQHGLKVSLSPALDRLPVLTDAEEHRIAQSLQARLLRYRMLYYQRVRDCEVDCKAFVPEMRTEARTWLAPICDCPELTGSVFEEIMRQSREAAGARFFDPRCVVTEAALFFCHKRETKHFFVGELTDTVNTLLKGRHEESSFSAKGVGLVLREIGLQGERVAEGYKISLTDAVRRRIHSLAFDYQVVPLLDGIRRCSFCPEGNAAPSKQIQ